MSRSRSSNSLQKLRICGTCPKVCREFIGVGQGAYSRLCLGMDPALVSCITGLA